MSHAIFVQLSNGWAGVAYLGVADELSVEIGIKGLHMATVNIQHRLPNNTDLKTT